MPSRKISRHDWGQGGYLLLPVVVGLVLIASIALTVAACAVSHAQALRSCSTMSRRSMREFQDVMQRWICYDR